MTSASRPGLRLSVVVAAWNGCSSLERCLRSLKDDGRAPDIEVIVVTNFDAGASEMLASRFSFVQHIAMPSGTTVPLLRTTGIWHSRGEIIALAEDHCTFGDDWSLEIQKAHLLPYLAIGGSVENASVSRGVDWAVYFYDYGKFMLPIPPGIVRSLSGNNASYKREVLKEVEASFQEGFFEPFTNEEIEKRGHALYLIPSAIVYNQKSHRLGHAAAQSYHLARGYAAKRVAGASLGRRGFFVFGSLLLPGILTVRIVARTIAKGRHVAALFRALPCLLLLMIVWSWGELLGYLAGEGGSAGEWK